jgi:general secretion pathway protein H
MRDMQDRQSGFTLIEIVAVLMVLAIVAGLVGARMGARSGSESLQATAYEFASRCRAARAKAIRRGSDQTVVIDLANRVVSAGEEASPLSIPATITILTDTSSSEQRSKSVAGIRFHPNGSSTGGIVRLEAGRRAYEIRVNWFTGRVSVEAAS